ncbi:hypothetical protein C0J52_25417 [Blattella germanica]|nr:hypothetical protein C0J52_25417 [Blattella germanica]
MYRLLIITTVFLEFHLASGLDADALQKDAKGRDHFLNTNCGKCTEPQKEFFIKMSRFVHQTRPDVWKALWDKYDSTRKNEKNILKLIGVSA